MSAIYKIFSAIGIFLTFLIASFAIGKKAGRKASNFEYNEQTLKEAIDVKNDRESGSGDDIRAVRNELRKISIPDDEPR